MEKSKKVLQDQTEKGEPYAMPNFLTKQLLNKAKPKLS